MTKLSKYEIIEGIGRGGFGVVYRARDTTLDRVVALKVLHTQLALDLKFVERFKREARTLAKLEHPHIITIYEVGETDGQLYIATELAGGPSVAKRIQEQGPFLLEEAMKILEQVTSALDYAHKQGLVHRDIKPSNILLDPNKGALLCDFGISKMIESSEYSLTAGGLMGTPAYIAPEMWEGERPTHASDVYALGCVFYEMVTGDTLFGADSPLVVMKRHDQGPKLDMSKLRKGFRAILLKALVKSPDERYQYGGEFATALRTEWKQPESRIPPIGTGRTEPPPPPVSDQNIRSIVKETIEEMVVTTRRGSYGGNFIDDKNSMVVWRQLYTAHKKNITNIIPEICAILQDSGHKWDTYWKALTLLHYSLHTVEGRQVASQALDPVCNYVLNSNKHVRDVALKTIVEAPRPPKDKWPLLFNLLTTGPPNSLGLVISKLQEFTPPQEREQTSLAILQVLSNATDSKTINSAVSALRRFNYRQSIPQIREILPVVNADQGGQLAVLLSQWRDKESIPAIRQAIENWRYANANISALIKSLYALEGPACSDYMLDILLDSTNAATAQSIISMIKNQNDRESIPQIRQMLPAADPKMAGLLAQLLSNWEDKESIPAMRQAIENWRYGSDPNFAPLIDSLYKLEGATCADYIGEVLLDAMPGVQKRLLPTLTNIREEPVFDAVKKLAETTSDPNVSRQAETVLTNHRKIKAN